jgi:hypothetical protein
MSINENVNAEMQNEEVIQPQMADSPNETPEKEVISNKEINFQKLRELKDKLEKENQELRKQVETKYQKQEEEKESDDEDFSFDDDDLVEGKVVKKLRDEFKSFKKSYEQEKMATIPDRLKTKFPDFDQVVTQENIDKLLKTEPELYASINSGSDAYAVGVSAYKTLKFLGIAKEDPYISQKEQVQRNQSRPISVQSIKGQSALSDANVFANGLTPELKAQLHKEMVQSMKAR